MSKQMKLIMENWRKFSNEKSNLTKLLEQQEKEMVEEGIGANIAAAILAVALSSAAQANPKLKPQADAAMKAAPAAEKVVKLDKKAQQKAAELARLMKMLDISDVPTSSPDEQEKALQGAGGVGVSTQDYLDQTARGGTYKPPPMPSGAK